MELGHLDDPDALVVAQAQEVQVSGHDQIGLGSHRTLQHPVVVWISLNHRQRHGGNDGGRRGADQAVSLGDTLV
jgi:hypothetical protein